MCLNNNSFFRIIPFSLQNGTHCGLFAPDWNRFAGIRDLCHARWVKWQHQTSSGSWHKIQQICWRYTSKAMETCFSFGIWIFANSSCSTYANVFKWTFFLRICVQMKLNLTITYYSLVPSMSLLLFHTSHEPARCAW